MRCFRPVVLRLLEAYVQRRRSAVVDVDHDPTVAALRDERAAVSLAMLLHLAPHCARCVSDLMSHTRSQRCHAMPTPVVHTVVLHRKSAQAGLNVGEGSIEVQCTEQHVSYV